MKKSHLQRGIALFLLIFALSDITSANPCGDELGAFPLQITDACLTDSASAIAAQQYFAETAMQSQGTPPVHSQHHETGCEDCFCCCSHILPSANFSHRPVELFLQISDLNKLVLPAAPPRDTFRPPRRA